MRNERRLVRLLVLLIILGVLALFFVKNFQVAVVQGKSMEPTFHDRQPVLITSAYWLFGPIQKGDVVVIQRSDSDLLIKRVVALPGEMVPSEVLPPETLPFEVPPNYVYVIGDNLEVSEDSRIFGPVPLSWIRGKVPFSQAKGPWDTGKP